MIGITVSSLVLGAYGQATLAEALTPWLERLGAMEIDAAKATAALIVLVVLTVLQMILGGLLPKAIALQYTRRKRSLAEDRWVYLWGDGIYSGLRADDQRLCALVVIGVNERGQKRFLAIEDGIRESTQSWREVLLDLKARGLRLPAKLAVGDGALGFWAAVKEIYPETAHQRCWVHKTANILNYLPKSVQPKAKATLHEIWMAETRQAGEVAFDQGIDAVFGMFDERLRLAGVAYLGRCVTTRPRSPSQRCPDERGKGNGAALARRAVAYARNHRIRTLFMHCLTQNRVEE